jgi:hypothetical protein
MHDNMLRIIYIKQQDSINLAEILFRTRNLSHN